MVMNNDAELAIVIETDSPDATRAVGEYLGRACSGGEIILLFGDLGSGKTCFVQGLARGLGVDAWVTSPTFTIHGEYIGAKLVLNHLDLYRLDDPASQAGLGLDDMLGGAGSVAAVEWPEMLADGVHGDRLEAHLTDTGNGRRELVFIAFGTPHAELLTRAMELK